eukprot:jgi/Bigna1/64691/fgenesh1_kg.82_\
MGKIGRGSLQILLEGLKKGASDQKGGEDAMAAVVNAIPQAVNQVMVADIRQYLKQTLLEVSFDGDKGEMDKGGSDDGVKEKPSIYEVALATLDKEFPGAT